MIQKRSCLYRYIRQMMQLVLHLIILFMPMVPICCATGTASDAKQGVVCIFATDSIQHPSYASSGSGFGVGIVGEETDIYVTNRHVVFNENTGTFNNEIYILLSDMAVTYHYTSTGSFCEIHPEEMVECEILYPTGADPEFPDVAILRSRRVVPGRIALPMMSSRDIPDGSIVRAIGYPGSADELGLTVDGNEATRNQSADISSSTMTQGVLSRKLRFPRAGNTWVLQHEAHINHGNSGGPLLNENGEVIGINTYGYTPSDSVVSEYNLAVFTDYAMNKLDELGIPYNRYPRSVLTNCVIVLPVAVIVMLAAILLTGWKKRQVHTSGFRLQGVSGSFASRRFPLEGVIRLGRDPSNNDLVYPKAAKGVSGRHCQIIEENGSLFLEDVGSSYGTYCNGQRLAQGQRIKLQPGDMFYLGQPSESFRIDSSVRR